MEKFSILTVIGIVGSFIAQLFGGWSDAISTLCIFMLIDYLSGLVVAGVFKRSPKTENGGLESKAGFKGICRKFFTLIIVIIAVRLDLLLNTVFVQNTVIITFIINETISIIENVGLMGVTLPTVINKALEMLSKKGDHDV